MLKNVALFIDAMSRQKDLNAQIAAAPRTLSGWTETAGKAGFQFSDADLHTVLQKVLDRKVPAESVVAEFLAEQSGPDRADLNDAQLDQVVGGASTTQNVNLAPSTLQRVAYLGGLGDGAAQWGMHIKGPFTSGNPGSQR